MPRRAWVATRKGLIELHRGPDAGWKIVRSSFLGDPVTMFLPPLADGPHRGKMLAALNLGHFGVKLHASADAGQTWNEVAAPVYPPQPKDAAGPPWTLRLLWSLEAGRDSATVWAGTLPGGLFRSADFGASWQLVESLWNRPERSLWFGGGYDVPGIHSISPHPTRSGELLLGVSCGGVWTSTDDGASWALTAQGMRANYLPPEQAEDGATQDPHALSRCAAHPATVWCQHHNGIFHSGDSGRSWREITSAPRTSFGFAVAAHPHEADTAWFAPAQSDQCRVPLDGAFVVHRTRDGGRSFEVLHQGLPGAHCFDLVYRHGLAVGHDGRTLLMGSTTGGLWTSFDGGEHWHTVSLNLPPINAIRFG